jgi:cytochrome c
MSSIEINKIVGAVLAAMLVAMVVGKVGDSIVQPRKHTAVAVATGGGQPAEAPAPAKEPEKLEPIGPLLAQANAEAGAKEGRKCATCHDLTKAAKKKIGPPLWNVVNKDKASEDFSYSGAMKDKGGKWTYEDLAAFLHNPKGFVTGTKMAFAGLKKPSDLANVIAYLRSLSDSPAPLP